VGPSSLPTIPINSIEFGINTFNDAVRQIVARTVLLETLFVHETYKSDRLTGSLPEQSFWHQRSGSLTGSPLLQPAF